MIEKEITDVFRSTEQLIRIVDDSELDWKPSSGSNWMTTAQLLMHISTACGVPIKDFIRGEPCRPEVLSTNQLRLLQITAHLNQRKTQLFYYLKLMGKAVSTRTLYGI
ncbi:MAG: hypothetical protein C1942_04135 [Prosthecochloris sp.]|nr:hypothetical protein [Prosthecochloris sp.]